MDLFDLQGKVAIVTGGNRGIGLGIARSLARAGASVAIAGRNAEKGAEACDRIGADGGTATFISVDIADEASSRAMISAAASRLGRLDILVNNAGFNIRRTPEEMTVDEFRQVLDTNLVGPFVCAQAAYPHLKAAGGGKIINVSSVAAFITGSRQAAYAPSKAGLVQLTRVLAAAWAKDNIQVNAILPGWVDTDMTAKNSQTIPGFAQQVVARTPASRWGRPDDFAGLAVYLASRASHFMTGSAIVLDGGYSFSV